MLGNYSRIGYEFKNRLNIFAVMKVKFNLRQTSDENKDTLIYLVCTINHKQEKISTGAESTSQILGQGKTSRYCGEYIT